jgi:hypothetical protein
VLLALSILTKTIWHTSEVAVKHPLPVDMIVFSHMYSINWFYRIIYFHDKMDRNLVRLCGCLNPWPTLVGFFLLVLSLTWEENNNMRVLWFVPIIDQYGIISNHTHYCAKQCTVFFNVRIVGFQLDVLLTVHVWSPALYPFQPQ